MRGLTAAVHEVLDRRLLSASPAPIAVALSGGGDSLALTLMVADWAKVRGRSLLVLTVDHGLRAESAAWTRSCAATADRLGADFQALAWEGDKPATGLPAAARSARHRLIADAARAAGAKVVLMGHTA
ncbi:MAG: ATP-binding protein, partial [Phenylobacterium sp.]|nr:ATP-binding protein [Phenylobacterium sp.]